MKVLMKAFYGGSHVKRMEKDRIAKRVCLGECTGSCSVGRPWKRWIDTVKKCLRKRGLEVRQSRRMVQHSSEWSGVCEGGMHGA